MNHTAIIAISVNALITDDHGQRLAALIAPVLLLSVWLPAWLLTAQSHATRTTHYALNWIATLIICCAALGLLIIERRFHHD